MSAITRTCRSCGASLGHWNFEVCAECLLRAGIEDPAARDETQDAPRIGAYRIVGQLASGEMGTVHLAEQDEPRRLVAIRVVRDGLDGERVLDRFRHEQEALGAMEHPGIARVYDAARLADGRPYFVMEFVDGAPITTFAARNRLSRAARIDLFLEVCDAVRHAHQRGVIHRDLKPSNVLVTIHHGRPRPKLIDFGVARAIGNRRTNSADTRTDVYGLGVVLYELLSGGVPGRAGAEPRPRSLRGDLDAIILKAVAKEPAGRYESVEGFADDLRRHLRAEPVVARAPGALYHASRFVTRHSWGVAAGVAFVLLLVSASAILAVQRARLAEAKSLAESREADANAVSAFLSDILMEADPKNPGSQTVTVREAVFLASDRLSERYGDRPGVHGMILSTLGHLQLALGNYDLAEKLLDEAVSVLGTPAGIEGPAYAEALVRLANVELRKGELREAAEHLNLALAARERLFGTSSLEVSELAESFNGAGHVALHDGDLERAEELFRNTLRVARYDSQDDVRKAAEEGLREVAQRSAGKP